ncbi:hypothetical protein NMY22_g2557 [Coprinellus aureogranulatus]|nr:hypothetical protein NMY22_g2557 [Coprinellus aureogranulatus]
MLSIGLSEELRIQEYPIRTISTIGIEREVNQLEGKWLSVRLLTRTVSILITGNQTKRRGLIRRPFVSPYATLQKQLPTAWVELFRHALLFLTTLLTSLLSIQEVSAPCGASQLLPPKEAGIEESGLSNRRPSQTGRRKSAKLGRFISGHFNISQSQKCSRGDHRQGANFPPLSPTLLHFALENSQVCETFGPNATFQLAKSKRRSVRCAHHHVGQWCVQSRLHGSRGSVEGSDLAAAACSVSLIYSHILTLGDEVARIWPGRRLSLAKILFFVNRYVIEGITLFNCFSSIYIFEVYNHTLFTPRPVVDHVRYFISLPSIRKLTLDTIAEDSCFLPLMSKVEYSVSGFLGET